MVVGFRQRIPGPPPSSPLPSQAARPHSFLTAAAMLVLMCGIRPKERIMDGRGEACACCEEGRK